MQNSIVAAFILFFSCSGFSKTVASSQFQIAPSNIDQVIRLVDQDEVGSSHKKLSIIVEDKGLSTDVSPRHSVYLGFASLAEMGTITANFKINDNAYEFRSAKRIQPGIYEVKTLEYRGDIGMVEVTQTIDATQLFIDDQVLRKQCGDDFCDQALVTSIEVSETLKK